MAEKVIKKMTLSSCEMLRAAVVGVTRQVEGMKLGRIEPYGAPTHPWEGHIFGACGELAVAKHLNLYWEGLAENPEDLIGDVWKVQVYTTTWPNGRLLIHKGDEDEARHYLVIAEPPVFSIIGWIRGRDAKREEFWDENLPRPTFAVPQNALSTRPLNLRRWRR
jgi:hypothetical protein